MGHNGFIGRNFDRMDRKLHVSNQEHYKFEGSRGFKNHGWPVMKGTIGTVSLVTDVGTSWTAGGVTLTEATALGYQAYGVYGPDNAGVEAGSFMFDMADAMKGNPLGVIGVLMTGADYLMDK